VRSRRTLEHGTSGFLRLSETKTANPVSENIVRKGLDTRTLGCVSPRECCRPAFAQAFAQGPFRTYRGLIYRLAFCETESRTRPGGWVLNVRNVAGGPGLTLNLAACGTSRRPGGG
jgi:hypothetical protein